MTDDVRIYYGFRQTSPKPPGQWVLCGGKLDRDEAKAEHSNRNVWDCELSPLFTATSWDEAKSRIDKMNDETSKSQE